MLLLKPALWAGQMQEKLGFMNAYIMCWAGDRTNLERSFRTWLRSCHTELDKRIRFLDICSSSVQVQLPSPRLSDAK